MMFHRHKWVEVKRTFNHPINRSFKGNRFPIADINRMIHGFTVIELRCICGDVRFRETLGAA